MSRSGPKQPTGNVEVRKMTEGQKGFFFLFLFAIFLIVIGVQGNLGTSFAILFCPNYITLDE